MGEKRGDQISKITGNEIVLLILASLLPYAVEGPDPIIFHMFFGYWSYFGWFPEPHFWMIFDFPPGLDIDIIMEHLYVWSVFVIIPLFLNVLLILSSIRNKQSKGSIHIVRYFAIGGLAYSIGISMMSGILQLPFTPVIFMILQTVRLFTKR